jgi:hypothetical protein
MIRKNNPVPVETVIEIKVPELRKDIHQKIIERPVDVIRTRERAVAVEKIVEVEVERVMENAKYIEKVVEKEVQFDQVIEEKFEILVPNIVQVEVVKEIHVPKKTIKLMPVEKRSYFENDVEVETTVVDIKESENEVEFPGVQVDDEVLVEKTRRNRAQIKSLQDENKSLRSRHSSLSREREQAASSKYNYILAGNARL